MSSTRSRINTNDRRIDSNEHRRRHHSTDEDVPMHDARTHSQSVARSDRGGTVSDSDLRDRRSRYEYEQSLLTAEQALNRAESTERKLKRLIETLEQDAEKRRIGPASPDSHTCEPSHSMGSCFNHSTSTAAAPMPFQHGAMTGLPPIPVQQLPVHPGAWEHTHHPAMFPVATPMRPMVSFLGIPRGPRMARNIRGTAAGTLSRRIGPSNASRRGDLAAQRSAFKVRGQWIQPSDIPSMDIRARSGDHWAQDILHSIHVLYQQSRSRHEEVHEVQNLVHLLIDCVPQRPQWCYDRANRRNSQQQPTAVAVIPRTPIPSASPATTTASTPTPLANPKTDESYLIWARYLHQYPKLLVENKGLIQLEDGRLDLRTVKSWRMVLRMVPTAQNIQGRSRGQCRILTTKAFAILSATPYLYEELVSKHGATWTTLPEFTPIPFFNSISNPQLDIRNISSYDVAEHAYRCGVSFAQMNDMFVWGRAYLSHSIRDTPNDGWQAIYERTLRPGQPDPPSTDTTMLYWPLDTPSASITPTNSLDTDTEMITITSPAIASPSSSTSVQDPASSGFSTDSISQAAEVLASSGTNDAVIIPSSIVEATILEAIMPPGSGVDLPLASLSITRPRRSSDVALDILTRPRMAVDSDAPMESVEATI